MKIRDKTERTHDCSMSQKKKLLFIDRRFTPTGGAQKYLDCLVLHCAKAGYDVELAVNSHPNIEENYGLLKRAGVPVYSTPLGEESAAQAAKWFKAFFAKSNPDIIHANTSCRELRQVLTRISNWEEMPCKRIFTMHLSLLSEDNSKSIGLQSLPWSNRSRTKREKKKFLDIFHSCVSVSDENGKMVSDYYDLPQNRILYIPNGVDIAEYVPQEKDHRHLVNPEHLEASPFSIGCCARLSKQKRLDILVRAVAGLSKESNVVLRLAGDGPERERLGALADELEVADRIEFLGTQDDICSFLHSLDLFVLTSDREGLPYALLEAMASGLPTIVTNVNEMPYVVRDGVDGLVIPTNDVMACQEKIRVLMDDPELRARLGSSARERVCEEYSESSSITKTLAVFDSLLKDQVLSS